MNRRTIAMLGGVGLLVAFAAAVFAYRAQQASELDALAAAHNAPPFVREYSQTLGPADARVVLVEFFDPGCETCRAFAKPVKDLVESQNGKVRLVLRYVPFHKGADVMVKAVEAARKQGKYWEALELIYDKQSEWADHHHAKPEVMWEYFPSIGLDMEKLRADMRSSEIASLMQQDMADAIVLGVRKTPTFIVNGEPLQRFGLDHLEALVQDKVAEAYGG